MAAGHGKGKSPSQDTGQISSKTEADNIQDVKNTSKELQRLSQMGSQIKVHEIIDDYTNDSKKAEEARLNNKGANGRDNIKQGNRQPQVMRFCPSLSTSGIDISVSGFTARAKQGASTARANMVLYEGVHYWEVTCPIRCTSIQIGVSSKGKDTLNS